MTQIYMIYADLNSFLYFFLLILCLELSIEQWSFHWAFNDVCIDQSMNILCLELSIEQWFFHWAFNDLSLTGEAGGKALLIAEYAARLAPTKPCYTWFAIWIVPQSFDARVVTHLIIWGSRNNSHASDSIRSLLTFRTKLLARAALQTPCVRFMGIKPFILSRFKCIPSRKQ